MTNRTNLHILPIMNSENCSFTPESPIYLDLVPENGEIIGRVYAKDELGRLPIAKVYAYHRELFSGKALHYVPVERVEWDEDGLKRLRDVWDLWDEHVDSLHSFLLREVWDKSGEYPRILGGEIHQTLNRYEFMVTKRGHYEWDEVVEDKPTTFEAEKIDCSFVFVVAGLFGLFAIGYIIYVAIQFIQALMM